MVLALESSLRSFRRLDFAQCQKQVETAACKPVDTCTGYGETGGRIIAAKNLARKTSPS